MYILIEFTWDYQGGRAECTQSGAEPGLFGSQSSTLTTRPPATHNSCSLLTTCKALCYAFVCGFAPLSIAADTNWAITGDMLVGSSIIFSNSPTNGHLLCT